MGAKRRMIPAKPTIPRIARLAKEAGVPWFSSSSLRYGEIGATMKFADATGATTFGPGPFEPHHYLDLSWYAIHPAREAPLFSSP
jgi:hypothetical protein